MSGKLSVSLKFDQRLMMSQQLSQAIMLLQYNTLDLKQLVKQYIETNPLIDAEETEADNQDKNNEQESASSTQQFTGASRRNNYYEDEENSLENYCVPQSLREHLLEQTLLCQFDPLAQVVAENIIDALDEDGLLTMSLDDIQKTMHDMGPPAIELIQDTLKTIQMFDPVGVGSRDIRESLLIQLDCLTERDKSWEIAHTIIHDFFDTVSTSNIKKMLKESGIPHDDYVDGMTLIRSLNPHPGTQYASLMNTNVEPELYVKKIKNVWQVFLTDSVLTNIKINSQYQSVIKQNKKHGSYPALKRELEEARWLLKGLKRRNETLLAVAMHIMEFQNEFLELGPSHMKPMNIADVAQALSVHDSTISRVTSGKYISTPRGVFELKYFFPSHVSTKSGQTCSDTAIKTFIKEIISQETQDHIYSDGEIAELLQTKGINIARRTVAKYREAIRILPSYQRVSLHHLKTEVET